MTWVAVHLLKNGKDKEKEEKEKEKERERELELEREQAAEKEREKEKELEEKEKEKEREREKEENGVTDGEDGQGIVPLSSFSSISLLFSLQFLLRIRPWKKI